LAESAGHWMQQKKYEALFTLGIALVFAGALWQSLGWNMQAGLFPWLITGTMLVLTIVQLGLTIRGQKQAGDALVTAVDYDLSPAVVRRRTANVVGWILGFVATIWLLGFPIAVPLLTLLYLKLGAGEKWALALGLAAVAGVLFYVLFVQVLNIFFERGVLLRALGS
jgi:hypothetical protein